VSDPASPEPRSLVGEGLRETHRGRLSPRIAKLEAAPRALETDPVRAEGELRGAAHVLRGSGASHGYPEVARRAADLEEAG